MNKRNIRTTYYQFGSSTQVVAVTHSKWHDFAARNAFYALSQNKYGAGVVEIVDEGAYNELHAVLTTDLRGNINTVFKRDPMRPQLLT